MESQDALQAEIQNLQAQLTEALDALEAIRSGGVDALMVYGEEGEQVYLLQGADQPYRVLVEAINEGAATLSTEGVVLWANAYLAEVVNAPLETILGTPAELLVKPEDRPMFEAALESAAQASIKIEIELLAKDSSHIPVLLSLSPAIVSDHARICMIATDLTEHKRNIEIAAAERMAAAIIEQAAEAIVVCDDRGKIIRASETAYRLAGQNPLFKPFEAIFPLAFEQYDPSRKVFSIQAVLQGERFRGLDACLKRGRAGGKVLSLQISARPLIIPEKGSQGCVITMTDVTERKQVEQSIQEYAQRLERSNKDLEDFAFIASHDLQEPLRKIQTFGDLLLQENPDSMDPKVNDYLRRMQDSANRMGKMITDLLSYSRLSVQAQPFGLVNLNEITQQVLSILENRIASTQGQCEIGELPVIEADPREMTQLLQNLLSNALKFHKPGEPPVVKIHSRQLNREKENEAGTGGVPLVYEIVVEDNGIGFDMLHAERIFQPFQRLHGRSEFEGNGIGLSICRKIVERHQGTIRVKSILNQGSTFFITLPAKQIF